MILSILVPHLFGVGKVLTLHFKKSFYVLEFHGSLDVFNRSVWVWWREGLRMSKCTTVRKWYIGLAFVLQCCVQDVAVLSCPTHLATSSPPGPILVSCFIHSF